MLRVGAKLRVAVALKAGGEQAELLAPVAEVVDADHPPATGGVQPSDRGADDRRPQVVKSERLRNVRG